jgi:hypothetical protein
MTTDEPTGQAPSADHSEEQSRVGLRGIVALIE